MKKTVDMDGNKQTGVDFTFEPAQLAKKNAMQAKARALFLEGLIRAGDIDYARILPVLGEYKEIAKRVHSKWCETPNGRLDVETVKMCVKFMDRWESLRYEYVTELKQMYRIIDSE